MSDSQLAALAANGCARDAIGIEELGAFLGEPESIDDAPYYPNAWRPALEGATPSYRPNFAALLFGPVWCLYRKLWFWGLVLWVAEQAFAVLFLVATLAALSAEKPDSLEARVAPWLGVLVLRVPFACCANHLYLRRGLEIISACRAHANGTDDELAFVRRAGGTSERACGLGILVNFSLYLGLAFAGA